MIKSNESIEIIHLNSLNAQCAYMDGRTDLHAHHMMGLAAGLVYGWGSDPFAAPSGIPQPPDRHRSVRPTPLPPSLPYPGDPTATKEPATAWTSRTSSQGGAHRTQAL